MWITVSLVDGRVCVAELPAVVTAEFSLSSQVFYAHLLFTRLEFFRSPCIIHEPLVNAASEALDKEMPEPMKTKSYS